MSLTRERLLAEMGIAPLWVRRDAQPVGVPEASAVPAAVEPTPSETAMDVETPAFEAPPRAEVPGFTADASPAVLPMLHAALENWQDVAGVVAPPILLVDPSALRLPRTMLETLCQLSTQALALSAGGPALRVSVLIDDRKSTHLCWSADNGVGLQLTARLPLGAEVA